VGNGWNTGDFMAMDVFERLNRRFGTWYEGLFGGSDRAAEIRPRDILRRILAAMEDNRREGLDGKVYVPNSYTVQVVVNDEDERDYLRSFLSADELAHAVSRAAEQHGYGLRGPLAFHVEEIKSPVAGSSNVPKVRVKCRFDTQAAPSAGNVANASNTPSPLVPAPLHGANAPGTLIRDFDKNDEPGTVPVVQMDWASLVARGPNGQLVDVFGLQAKGAKIGRGRTSGNDIVLEDAMVSKRHARIEWEKNRFILYDDSSTNGTHINGSPVRSGVGYPLNPGDEIRMGGTTLTFRPSHEQGQPAGADATFPVQASSVARTYAAPEANGIESNGARATFRLIAGDGEVYSLASEMSVGRALTSDISLIATGVASRHANLTVRGDTVYVEDLDTPGGTFVNGERIPARFPVTLVDGDQIAFGEARLRLERREQRWAQGSAYGNFGAGQ
jgi:pSer/pThr/pTyr-binding forkhead associated (FHA) protein